MRTSILTTASAILLLMTSSYAETIFGTVVKVQGQSPTIAVGGLAKVLAQGAKVGPGGIITAGPTGSLVLRLTPCTALEMGSDAVVSLDDLQLTRGTNGVTVRQGEFTLSKGQGKFIIEGMETRINVPGGVISVTQAGIFSAVAAPNGDVALTVLSGKVSVTNSAGETTNLKANEYFVVGGAGSVSPQSADNVPAAQDQLVQLQQSIETTSTLGLLCTDTLNRLHAEFFTIEQLQPSPGSPPTSRPRVPERPPVSPDN